MSLHTPFAKKLAWLGRERLVYRIFADVTCGELWTNWSTITTLAQKKSVLSLS